MNYRRYRLLLHRKFRKSQRQVGDLSTQAEEQIEKHLFGRFSNLNRIRRFIFGWVGLLIIICLGMTIEILSLSGFYQVLEPVPGGIYNEGIVGNFTNANPIFASNDVDTAVSRLIFSGLVTYDNSGHLVGDLASSWSVDDHGIVYTFHLRPNLKWQDGQPLTSADVLYTFNLIQSPDVGSPFESSWQGIKISAPDSRTVVFTLPGALASFPYSLTIGIVPQHILSSLPTSSLRSADFNTLHPIGSGPFAWKAIAVTTDSSNNAEYQIELTPFSGYALGKPKLGQFVIHTYPSTAELATAFSNGQLTGAQGFDTVPTNLANKLSVVQHNLPLTAEQMVFFKTSQGVLSEQVVRHALVEGTDQASIINSLGYPVIPVNEPLLIGQLGYDPTLAQPKYNLADAKSILTSNDWIVGANGIRQKDGQPLTFTLSADDTPDDHVVGNQLQAQWQKLGVKLSVDYLDNLDFQSAVNYHDYDAILDGISIGPDPDVFVYWDSSQADVRSVNRLNLSEYNSAVADASLETGRSRINPAIRAVIYKSFLQAWQQDNPALGLYQPRDLYLTNGPVAGFVDHVINSPTDRYDNVQNWEIRQAKVSD